MQNFSTNFFFNYLMDFYQNEAVVKDQTALAAKGLRDRQEVSRDKYMHLVIKEKSNTWRQYCHVNCDIASMRECLIEKKMTNCVQLFQNNITTKPKLLSEQNMALACERLEVILTQVRVFPSINQYFYLSTGSYITIKCSPKEPC